MEQFTATVIATGVGFGEAPRWHEGRLWFSDFYRHGIFSIAADGRDERLEHAVPTQPSGLDWDRDGALTFVSMTDHQLRRLAHGEESLVADLTPYCGFWANDMAMNEHGVAYVGNFGFDLDTLLHEKGVEGLLADPPPTTNMVVVAPSGAILQVVPDLAFPNGTVITPDGRTLIVGETMAFRLTAFDIAADGTLSNRRVWAQMDFVATDGMCLDDEGQIWLANALTNEVRRVAEGGACTATVTTSQTAFACMLGGEDDRELFIMTAPSSDRFQIADRRDGAIEKVTVSARRAGRP
jgi:sugar lactone lactonase YvrE